jgi:hypothetical protein
MDAGELQRFERRARLKYEGNRALWALIGVVPAGALIAIAAQLGRNARWPLSFGALMLGFGAMLLWYGRELKRALLPGLAAGLLPLTFALCATHVGHVCTGDRCMMVCLPACAAGGLVSGVALALIGRRATRGAGFWLSASAIALLTGAMGCACIGISGVIGLLLGFALGFAPWARGGYRASSS